MSLFFIEIGDALAHFSGLHCVSSWGGRLKILKHNYNKKYNLVKKMMSLVDIHARVSDNGV